MKIHSLPTVLLLAIITLVVGMRHGGVPGAWGHGGEDSAADEGVTFYYTIRVSVATNGQEADAESNYPAISGNGRYVAFSSNADTLVEDTYPYTAIYVHDTLTRETVRVSVTPGGATQDYASTPDISADGRYVAYYGTEDTVVDGNPTFVRGVYVRDRQTSVTTMVSIAPDGAPGDLGASSFPAISDNGRFVAFSSRSTNLVTDQPQDDCPDFCDRIYVHDRETGLNKLVSVSSNGTPGNQRSVVPDIAADGRFVVYSSHASNLVAGDENGEADVFVHDQLMGQTSRISVASDGTEANGPSGGSSISADGRYVAFNSRADNLVAGDTNNEADVFVHDRLTGETTRVSVDSDGSGGNNWAGGPSISADGRYVAFASSANNLTVGDANGVSDIFVHDRQTGETKRVSIATGGAEGNGSSLHVDISGDGASVAFASGATNLVENDKNMCPQSPYEEHLPGACPDIFFYRSYEPPPLLTESTFLPLIHQ